MSELGRILNRLDYLEGQVAARGQLGRSSLEAGQAIPVNDEDGNTRVLIGNQPDGTTTVTHLTGPTPPVPGAPLATSDGLTIMAEWLGDTVDATPLPADLRRARVYVSQDPDHPRAPVAEIAQQYGGTTTTVVTSEGTWWVWLALESESGQVSDLSTPAQVEVTMPLVSEDLQTAISDAEDRINQATDEALGQVDGKVTEASRAASAAQDAADRAAEDAAAAAGIANGKSTTLIQPSAPAPEYRLPSTLWIDTTSGANTPKRWNGTSWVAVTDKTATDAAAAAAQAAQTAQTAQNAAGTAKERADYAVTMAGSKTTATYGTTTVAGTGQTDGDTYRQRDGSQNIIAEWRWNAATNQWIKQQISSAAIANLDVGKLTAGAGVLQQAVIDVLWSKVVRSQMMTTDMLLVPGGSELVADPYMDGRERTWNLPAAGSYGRTWSTENTRLGHGTSVRMVSNAVGSANMSKYGPGPLPGQRIPVSPGSTYTASAWCWATDEITGLVSTENNFAGVSLQLYTRATQTSTGESGTRPAIGPDGAVGIGDGIFPAGRWVEVGGQFTVPDDAPYGFVEPILTMYFPASAPAFAGALHIGQVSIREVVGGTLIEDGSIDTNHLRADSIEGIQFKGNAFQGITFLGAIFQAGNTSISDAFGLQQVDDAGNVLVSIPGDGTPAQFRGDVVADNLETPSLSLTGEAVVLKGARLMVASGVTKPSAPLSVSNVWDTIALPAVPAGSVAKAFTAGGGYLWRYCYRKSDHAELLQRIHPTTLAVNTYTTGSGPENEETDNAEFSIAYLNNRIYVLWTVKKYKAATCYSFNNTGGGWKDEVNYTDYGTATYRPGIGVDGSKLVIAQCWADGKMTIRKWAPSGSSWNKTDEINTQDTFASDCTNVWVGAADTGASRAFVQKRTDGFITAYNGTAYDGARAWRSRTRSAHIGFGYDSGTFYSLAADGRIVTKFGGVATAATTAQGDNAYSWRLAYTWTGPDGQETMLGPAMQTNWDRRAGLAIQGPSRPDGVTGANLYLNQGPALSGWRKIGTLPLSTPGRFATRTVLTQVPNWQAGAGAPTKSTFGTSDYGTIQDEAGKWALRGDGTVQLPGVPYAMAAGTVNITPTAPNTPTGVTVKLPTGRFSVPPMVVLGVNATTISNVMVGSATNTSTSITVYLRAPDSTNRWVNWSAIQMDSGSASG
ncbi:hypothetical protein NQ036_06765 [Brevibacterium sp. 91QC2O2]|uniref:hypothetical protein n=1 Tax=Brevibacterium sp. 91QC2O2 TaxID=2968458 RepID=UPI00211CF8D3|nr:hypothetical protein [Brevibacterium sp. 91QC2O2]MCQ9367945.1 hypothetical protein [Brevibacterium sp. 91QC2O2]